MSHTPKFDLVYGDLRTPLGRTLRQGGKAVDLDGLTVEGTRECVPALLDQERRFLGRLGSVVRFEITPDGALRLRDARDGLVLARR